MNNEDQIARELAAKVPEDVPAPQPTNAPDTTEEPQNFVDKLLPEEQLTRSRLLDYLQVPTAERYNPIVDNYINTIYEWARDNAGEADYYQLIRVIQEQEQIMGSRLKPGRLQRLAEYVKISKMRQQLATRERELYYG